MRLLKRSNDGEFSLTKDFLSGTIPEYGILSHRWGSDTEEVTYRDLKDGAGKNKTGYEKIRFCGEQARHDGLHYFWVDSCCIDKTNSAELQESINSMFQWYRYATRCYVYLSDVSTDSCKQESLSVQSWEPAFRNSKWFTRGWTLQELIAPPSLEFFCSNGNRLGDKESLKQQIHEITLIPVRAFTGTRLSEFGVSERMSWAKNRETQREEDKAYCLLGIFDIHMALIYGEGMGHAFRRLREEIGKLNLAAFDEAEKEKAKKRRVMNWLSNTPYTDHHRNNRRSRSEGSGEWLLSTTNFKEWKNRSESAILWLHGSPGSGKTLLISRVIDSVLHEQETAQTSTPIAYFYCSRTSDDTKRGDPSNVLRTIAKQLARPTTSVPLATPLACRYKKILDSDSERELEIDESVELIIELKESEDIDSAIIIIDALDECNNQDRKREALLQGLKTIASSPGKAVKIFAASRDEVDIKAAFSDCPELWISAQDNRADIQKYVDEQLEKEIQRRFDTCGRRISTQLETKIRKTLVEKADGIFRWVGLQLQALFDMNVNKIEGDMYEQLSTLPRGLKASYDVIYRQLQGQGRSSQILAHKAIAWLLCARQPLSTAAFIQALNVGSDRDDIKTKEDVIDICCNFIKHDEDLDRFRIFHLSVTNYFEDERVDWPATLLDRVVANICLEQCLSPLSRRENFVSKSDNKTLTDYANVYWPYHCSRAGANQSLGILKVPLESKLHSFLLGGQTTALEFSKWNSACSQSLAMMNLDIKDIESKAIRTRLLDSLSSSFSYTPSRTFVACAFGFCEIVEKMIDGGEDFTVRTQETRLQPLYVAIRHDHRCVQDVIRERVPSEHSFYLRSMELHAAVRTGKDAFVLWLLDQQAENLITYGILEGAALHCNTRTFRRLQALCPGPANESDFWKDNLLVAAARNEEHGDRIVQLLLHELHACSDEVYAAAASNENHGLSILRLLFETFRPMEADRRMITAVVSNHEIGSGLLKLVRNQFPGWKPDEEVLITTASKGSVQTLEYLLDVFSPVQMIQEIWVAAVSNQKNGLELTRMLLTYDVEVSNLDSIIIAAMENSNFGSEITAILLERFEDISSIVLEEATTMRHLDIRIFKRLLNLPGRFTLNDVMIENAARNQGLANELIKLFRELRKDDLATRNHLLAEAIIGNITIVPAIMEEILCHVQDTSLLQDALWHAASFPRVEILRDSLKRVDAPEGLGWLVESIVTNTSCGIEMAKIIFTDIPGLPVTTEAIEIASQNHGCGHDIVKYLIDRDPEVIITLDALLAATKNRDRGILVMPILLARFHGRALIDETTVACASHPVHAYELMKLLFEHDFTDWSREPFLTTLFFETLVHEGNFQCLKLLEKKGVSCTHMEVYGLGSSSRIDPDVLDKLLSFCDEDTIKHDLIYRVVSGAYNEDDLSIIQKLLPGLQPGSVSEQSLYQAAIDRREGASQMLQLLQVSDLSTNVKNEIVLEGVISLDVLFTLDSSSWTLDFDEGVLIATARNLRQGLQVFRFLWRKRANLQITENVLVAAASNWNQGVQLYRFLWEKKPDLHITESVLVAAAGNGIQGVQILDFLWKKKTDFQITENVLKAAAGNWGQGLQVLGFLWEKKADVQITENVLKAAAGNGKQGVQIFGFLWKQKANLQITENILVSAAGNGKQGIQIFGFLWQKKTNLQITENVLVAATRYGSQGVQIFQFLWKKQTDLQITENLLKTAAENWSEGVQILQFLWKKKAELQITENLLKAAAENWGQGVQILQFLWKKQADLHITENVLVAAAENWGEGLQVLGFLWKKKTDLQTTENVLKAAAKNRKQGAQTLRFLWKKQADLQITENVLVAAAENWGQGVQVLGFLWKKKTDFQITENVLVAAAENWDQGVQVLGFLWKKKTDFQITENVLKAAAENWGQGLQVLGFLWKKKTDLQITESVLVAAAGNGDQGIQIFRFLWKKQADVQITENVLVAAAENWNQGIQIFRFLWKKQADLQITENVLKAAARNEKLGKQILGFLYDKQSDFQFAKNILATAAGNWGQGLQILEFLLNRQSDLQITEEVLKAAAGNWGQGLQVLKFLWKTRDELYLTQDMLKSAIKNWQQGVPILKFFWSKLSNTEITEELLEAANESWEYGLEVLKKRWKHQFGVLTSGLVSRQLGLQEQQRNQIFELLQAKQRRPHAAASVG